MKKSLLVMLLAVSCNASASWSLLGSGEQPKYELYADLSTKEGEGGVVKIWTMYNLSQPMRHPTNGSYFKSYKIQAEYNCLESSYRPLFSLYYSGNMGKGDVVFRIGEGVWEPVSPGSSKAVTLETACTDR